MKEGEGGEEEATLTIRAAISHAVVRRELRARVSSARPANRARNISRHTREKRRERASWTERVREKERERGARRVYRGRKKKTYCIRTRAIHSGGRWKMAGGGGRGRGEERGNG